MTENGSRIVYVVGAGIAGLSLALFLERAGFTVLVLERARSIDPIGTGIQLSPNASRLLERLGLEPALARAGFEPEAIDVYGFGHKKPLAEVTLGQTARQRFGAAYRVIHRGDLAQILYEAARKRSRIEIALGARNIDMVRHSRGLTVSAELGDGSIHTGRPYALIGADGVHSEIRRKFMDGPDARYSGYVAWRATLGEAQLAAHLSLNHTSLCFGPGFHGVFYPLAARQLLNVVLSTKVPAKRAFAETPPTRPKIDPYYLKRSALFGALMKLMGDKWTFWPLNAVEAPRWHDGQFLALVGDAAHAMLPFQAQGAAMGIEDAAVMARQLSKADSPGAAFEGYESERRRRVSEVQALSRRNGTIFHMPFPFSIARNAGAARRGGTAQLDDLAWIYGFDADQPPRRIPG